MFRKCWLPDSKLAEIDHNIYRKRSNIFPTGAYFSTLFRCEALLDIADSHWGFFLNLPRMWGIISEWGFIRECGIIGSLILIKDYFSTYLGCRDIIREWDTIRERGTY